MTLLTVAVVVMLPSRQFDPDIWNRSRDIEYKHTAGDVAAVACKVARYGCLRYMKMR